MDLACTAGTTQNADDLIAVFEAAITSAEEKLGDPLILDCVNNNDVIEPVVIVTDNGGAMRSAGVDCWFAACPHFVHVRTRVKSPGTNGVAERFFSQSSMSICIVNQLRAGLILVRRLGCIAISTITFGLTKQSVWVGMQSGICRCLRPQLLRHLSEQEP